MTPPPATEDRPSDEIFAVRQGAAAESHGASGVHAPHSESWDVATRTGRNREGTRVPIERCEVTEFGLFVRREFLEPLPRSSGMDFWLLPSLGLRVISWIRRPDVDGRDLEDYYIDMCAVTVDGDAWQMVDQYLDVLVWTGKRLLIDDQDEFVAATLAGYLTPADAEAALAASYLAVEGITRHNYDVNAWLRSSYGINLTWPI